MKANKEDHDAITAKLEELKNLKQNFLEVTGNEFVGGSVPAQTPKKKAAPAADVSPVAPLMPPPPPEAQMEAAVASTAAPPATYAASIVVTACRLVGKETHGTPLFDANTIVAYLLEHAGPKHAERAKALLGGGTPEAKAEVAGWMGMAAKVDDAYYADDFALSANMQLNSILSADKAFIVGDALTFADVAMYTAVQSMPGTLPDPPSAPVAQWLDAVKALVEEGIAAAAVEADAELPPPPAPAAALPAPASPTPAPDGENTDPQTNVELVAAPLAKAGTAVEAEPLAAEN